MNQTSFLDDMDPLLPFQGAAPPSAHRPTGDDSGRLDAQRAKILARLQDGPAMNTELYAIALNASARVSELRKLGHRIRAKAKGGGLFSYELLESK